MNRQVLLDVIREMKGIQKHGQTLKFVLLDKRPDPRRVRTAITPIRRAFSSTVFIGKGLSSTGEVIDRFVQVVHNEVLTRRRIEAVAQGFLDERPLPDSGEEMIELSLLLVEQVKRA